MEGHKNRKKHKFISKVEYKHCFKCKEWKTLNVFNKNKNVWDGLNRKCRECEKQYRLLNKERLAEKNKQYRISNKEKIKEYKKNNKEKYKEYDKNYQENYRKSNKEALTKYFKTRYQKKKTEINRKNCERIRNNNSLRLLRNLRCRINKAIKCDIKSEKTRELLGCSIEKLKYSLEKKFKDGMNWNNYGRLWHIDHIIPCAAFNMESILEQRLCFYYKNLQPLWKKENLCKNNKFNECDKKLYKESFVFFIIG